jgi:hypothetical protein
MGLILDTSFVIVAEREAKRGVNSRPRLHFPQPTFRTAMSKPPDEEPRREKLPTSVPAEVS